MAAVAVRNGASDGVTVAACGWTAEIKGSVT
jgi:hypothetical protein